jgi:Ca2+-binding RTX toxin-like protein
MSTTPGGQGIPVAPVSPTTQAAVSAFFVQQGWVGENFVPVNGSSFGTGFVTTVDNNGQVVTTVGTQFDKGVFKIKDLSQGQTDEVLIGTGSNTEVRGTSQGNVVTIIDDANHGVKLGGGDDIITNLGSGGGTFRGGAGSDTMTGGGGNEVMHGGDGRDVLNGGGGNDQLFGGRGHDVLAGGQGDDLMTGGRGADVLTGGAGNDTMTGGVGKDTFVFGSEQTGRDVITDFHKGDTLNLIGKQQANIDHTVTQVGSNTVLTFTDGSIIVLEKVDSTDLVDDNGDGLFNI